MDHRHKSTDHFPQPMHHKPTHDFPPFFRVDDNGHVERYLKHDFVPPSDDPQTGIISRDVTIPPMHKVSVRIFLPKNPGLCAKLPLVIYIHGGGFSVESAFSSTYHNYAKSLASKSESIVASIEYRLAPEHPVPTCYDDCRVAVKWILAHARAGQGPDQWFNHHADFQRVFIAGDSAGANIAHNVLVRTCIDFHFKFFGLILVHPFFGGGEPDDLWEFVCPGSEGVNDPRMHPMVHKDLMRNLASERVLVCIAEKDLFRERGLKYYETLKTCGWKGSVELFETKGEGHVFHLMGQNSVNAAPLMETVVSFIKGKAQCV